MTPEHAALIERLLLIFVPPNAPDVAADLRARLSDSATLDYTAFHAPALALALGGLNVEIAVAAERERCEKAVEGVYLDYDCCARAARQMLTAIREGKS